MLIVDLCCINMFKQPLDFLYVGIGIFSHSDIIRVSAFYHAVLSQTDFFFCQIKYILDIFVQKGFIGFL